MTANDHAQREVNDRLMAALIKLDLFTRRDEHNRLFASDGEHEYQVVITADEGDTNYGRRGASKLVIGQRTLRSLEGGRVSALFWWGVARPPLPEPDFTEPVSPYYEPLEWSAYELIDQHDSIEAQGEDWKYEICLVTDRDGEIVYHVRGGDMEESDDIGWEDSLPAAKAAAQENYAARYLELERVLFDIVRGYRDDDGNLLARRDEQGRIFCRVSELGGEVEIVATLADCGDFFDTDARRWAVCPRSANAYSYRGEWVEGMYEDMRRAGALGGEGSQ